ncbi:MAG: MBL fold metallo-hydrolase [Candidatus Gastranaerophilales bacterium]|nr:MBL fold metallo-hydrolase [Candidatus Gastranaerophilales bacterium]
MSEFKVKFRGVRGSYPVANEKYLKYGGNTSCVEVNAGGHLIILDAGTGLIELGTELMTEYIESGSTITERKPINAVILISHIHQDHIIGIPFFKPMHLASTKLYLFGGVAQDEKLETELSRLLFTKTFPLDLGDIAAELKITDLNETNYIILSKNKPPIVERVYDFYSRQCGDDDVVISCYKSFAHPQSGVFVYKISYKGKSLVYASDKESYPGGDKKLIKFARNCNLLIHDAQYTTEDYLSLYTPKQGFGHSTYEMALDAKNQIGAEKLVFFHYDPAYDDDKIDELTSVYEKDNAIMAKEGLEIELL